MKKFKFSLQRVLGYRKSIEEALLVELTMIQEEHERELALLAELTAAREMSKEQMKERLRSGEPEEIVQAHSYLQELTGLVFCQTRAVQIVAERRAKKNAEVVEAAKNRKVLERLKEYKAAEHRKEFEREDQNFLDGLATCKHARSINNGGFNESGAH